MSGQAYLSDIPVSVARAAHNGTSFNPEKRGDQARAEYAQTLFEDFEMLSKHANTEEKKAILSEEFARFREGYAKRYNAYLYSSARCVSSFIAGPSNFPVARMNKRAEIVHKRLDAFTEYREIALKAIKRKLHPELAPIMTGDSDATQRLEKKIQDGEKLQAIMKAANNAIRKNAKAGAKAQVMALVALGFHEDRAIRLLAPDFCGRIGFADYELTNNNANIRRMKGRLVGISRLQATPEAEHEGINATVNECPSENRVRIKFPGKPNEEIRTRLKTNGFRWTPSLEVWQAYYNANTVGLAKAIAEGK